ncbi:hypothetical protein Pyn_26448 [Prunus yedoensis var. nudiflora]|uniref:Uncharacterized protein n=1 Tax=Prunus yedoensis var. nudiflora TaxID=2094558 RepID=A0A314ZDI8_PRUYE|nr:hypothetical protein Pyn_26448 [Prunus yedoensis var. nudiflora]
MVVVSGTHVPPPLNNPILTPITQHTQPPTIPNITPPMQGSTSHNQSDNHVFDGGVSSDVATEPSQSSSPPHQRMVTRS